MTPEQLTKLDDLVAVAQKLASDLYSNDLLPCIGLGEEDGSCLQKEEARSLTRKEVANGWARRPFWAYDQERLCPNCLAYWHADLCAQELHRRRCMLHKYGY